MKIKEIIELSKTDSLAKIAKDHLSVGKERAREALKQAGCYSKNGLKGWHFDGDESVLEQSIYDFVTTTRKTKAGLKSGSNTGNKAGKGAGINAGTNAGNQTGDIAGKERVIKQSIKPVLKEVSAGLETTIKTSTNTDTNIDVDTDINTNIKPSTNTDILDRLYAGIDPTEDKREVSFYLTHDVIEVINRTKKGYRSDLVNEALRKVFKEKGWL